MAGYTWTELVPKYRIDPDDLPMPHAPNVVVIERVEFERKEDKRKKGEFYNQVELYLFGWNVPLRLNQTKIKQLRDMFGDDINAAHGKKIALTIIVDTDDNGNPRPAINIHPYVVPEHTEPTPVPLRLAVQSDHGRRGAAHYGVQMAGSDGQPRPMLPASSPKPDWRTQGASKVEPAQGRWGEEPPRARPERTGEPIGLGKALEVYKTLHQRGRMKGDLIAHVGKTDTRLADQMAATPASEWPDVVLDFARALCQSLPVTTRLEAARIDGLQKELDADLAEYQRLREEEARAAGAADRKFNAAVAGRGQPEPLAEDDIPF